MQVVIFDINDVTMGPVLEFLVTLYSHQAPIRMGLVPVAKEGDAVGSLLAQVFYKLIEEKEGPDTLTLMSGVSGYHSKLFVVII